MSLLYYSYGIVVRYAHSLHTRRKSHPQRLSVICAVFPDVSVVQPYKGDFERVGGAINSLDPEIKLAIQFSTDKSNSAVATSTQSDGDQEVDEFVSSHGFEFIDGDNDNRARVLDSDGDSTGEPFPSRKDPYVYSP